MRALLLLLLPISALATEVQLACDLERAKAEVQASVLGSSAVVGGVGQDAASGQKSVNIGLTKSLSGATRAGLLREAADAKCDALKSTLRLDEHGRWAVAAIERAAADIEFIAIQRAIFTAFDNVTQLEKQLEAQVTTITQVNDARQQLANLQQRAAALETVRAVKIEPPPGGSISSLVGSAISGEGRAARLSAQSQSETGWDTSITAGIRQPIGGVGGSQPFAGITFKYSFGVDASRQAAKEVGLKTEQLMLAQQGGYAEVLVRQRVTANGLLTAAYTDERTTEQFLDNLRVSRQAVADIETALAQNVRRSLDVQIFGLEARLEGIKSRVVSYIALLEKLQ